MLVTMHRNATLCSEARLDCLEWWLCNRQMRLEGGFQGRTNKLVDGCYSFWQGGTAALLEYQRRGKLGDVVHRAAAAVPTSAAAQSAAAAAAAVPLSAADDHGECLQMSSKLHRLLFICFV
jgi:Prenyltransferase and squalene oxidase repeat